MTAPDHAAERKRIVLVNTAMEARLLTALDAKEGELQAALARAEAADAVLNKNAVPRTRNGRDLTLAERVDLVNDTLSIELRNAEDAGDIADARITELEARAEAAERKCELLNENRRHLVDDVALGIARIAALVEGLRQLVEFAEGEVSDTIDWSETSLDFDEAWGAIVPDARALLTPEPPAVKDAT